MKNSNGFIIIENVFNLTISGSESSSLIECSPQSSFGFHLSNATNVRLAGFRIRNCGSAVPKKLMKYLNFDPNQWKYSCLTASYNIIQVNSTSVLIESSRNVVLSRVNIDESPGYAIAVIDFTTDTNDSDIDSMEPIQIVNNCTISHSRGSIVVFGTQYLLVEKTVIINNTIGIASYYKSHILLKEVDLMNCTLSYLQEGHVVVRGNLTINNSLFCIVREDLYIISSNVLVYGADSNSGVLTAAYAMISISENSVAVFTKFWLTSKYSAIDLSYSSLNLNNCYLNFTANTASFRGLYMFTGQVPSVLRMEGSTLDMANESYVVISNNGMKNERMGLEANKSEWRMAPDTYLFVMDNINFSMLFRLMNVSLHGKVRIANNSVSNLGIMLFTDSIVWFKGSLDVVENRAESGGITAFHSDLFFTSIATFMDNQGDNGGALTLISSFMYVSPNATVTFTNNQAKGLGAAVYITKPKHSVLCGVIAVCTIKVLGDCSFSSFPLSLLTFNQNKAGVAGNAIYGGHISACSPFSSNCSGCQVPDSSDLFFVNDSSDISSFTSDPTRVCFCENTIPNCYKVMKKIAVFPGEDFILSLCIVGYGLGTVPGSVIAKRTGNGLEHNLFGSKFQYSQEIRGRECEDVRYSVVSERDKEQFTLSVQTQAFGMYYEQVKKVVSNHLNRSEVTDGSPMLHSTYDSAFEAFFHIPVFVDVSLALCPVGFQLVGGRCVCHRVLLDNDIDTCSIYNGTGHILRPAHYWIRVPSNTNASILIHSYCPFDYCQSKATYITAGSQNTQCQNNRSGVLCGTCRSGFSIILGSSGCKVCSNIYLISITIFIVMGFALVTLVSLLNLTVSVGTLNGLIFFANILQANQSTCLLQPKSHTSMIATFLGCFLAWLNLDLGIPMCFFDGLTTYVKTWLQFVFPLYIMGLVGVIVTASKYSAWIANLLGTNAVSVLATLFLLSYTKILRILITAFSFTTLTGSDGYYSVVWLADGNIRYFELKHGILFVVAMLVLFMLGFPYTITLTAAPWMQRSRLTWMSSTYNKFKPVFDAYMGPYKDNRRYWVGIMLLARVFLMVLFSSIANTNTVAGPRLNLLLLSVSSSALLALTAFLKPYKNRLLNGLEMFYLASLFLLSSSSLYLIDISNELRAYIYIILVGISFFVFVGVCVGHIWSRVRQNAHVKRRSESEEQEHHILQRTVTDKDESEEEEEIDNMTISTAADSDTDSNGGRTDSLVELIAENLGLPN